MKLLRGTLFGSLMVAATAGASELYRWVDADGRVHFSDRPPAEAKAQDISGQLNPINSAEATKNRPSLITSPATTTGREQQKRQQKEQQARQQEQQRNCSKARQRLRAINGRVAFIDNNGKEVRYSERERQQMAKKLQREIASRCG
ncbi:DUF4124 domain-containing protein [uncultured Microbulbifer sp.]|uniref:DUF4124 domain-containing protein n=1 Tax=uncultured Microbulbifer sp. TaxID=348147 RepID=UPI0026283D7D|nr:DUF4124 domain-containing protein [uncultured Microbulbifer sp.]